MEIRNMLKDSRKITYLILSQGESVTVDLFSGFTERVEAIKVYPEPGPGVCVPWFAVMNDAGEIMARVNAATVQMVLYDDPG